MSQETVLGYNLYNENKPQDLPHLLIGECSRTSSLVDDYLHWEVILLATATAVADDSNTGTTLGECALLKMPILHGYIVCLL